MLAFDLCSVYIHVLDVFSLTRLSEKYILVMRSYIFAFCTKVIQSIVI